MIPTEEKKSIVRNLKNLLAATVTNENTVITICRMIADASTDSFDFVSINIVLL
jgi:hypothetical protein